MASVTRLKKSGCDGWRVRFYCHKRQRELYLTGVSRKIAETVGRHCDELAGAKQNNVDASGESRAWAAGTTGKLLDSLVAWGLTKPVSAKAKSDAGRLLGPFLDAYIAGRSDCALNTIKNFKQCRRELCVYFGERHPLVAINAADAERWKRAMLARVVKPASNGGPARTMAVATASKHVKRAKTMFAEAVSDKLLEANPFAKLKGGSECNPKRLRIINSDVATKVLEACPDADWRLIFSLARFGGLRVPSEIRIRWTDVDWHQGRFRIDSPKTGVRHCPLFPELLRAFQESWEVAEDGAEFCLSRHRSSENLRTQFGRILASDGIDPWPRLFQNLRSTRRTELQETYPNHVINAWLGQSTKVAEKHYLKETDEHWQRAVSFVSLAAPLISNQSGAIASNQGIKKPLENMLSDASQGLVMAGKVPPEGLENPSETMGKTQSSSSIPLLLPSSATNTWPSGALDDTQNQLQELAEIWPNLDAETRAEIVAIVRERVALSKIGDNATITRRGTTDDQQRH